MRKMRKIGLFLIVLIVLIEVFLRSYLGFCNTVLMKESNHYEYIAKPNQEVKRFRHHNYYNSHSMRSEEVNENHRVFLCFGDSVINGGILTDNEDLATSILSDTLTKKNNERVQFLNVSAGSWGPDNCYAYLKEKGDFGAEALFLIVSSHDAYDNMSFKKIVGGRSHPSEQYKSAIYELFDRYLIPKMKSKLIGRKKDRNTELLINKKKEKSIFNTGFKSFYDYSKKNKLPLTIYLHADQSELNRGKYNEQGKEIIKFAKQYNIPLIKDLENGLSKSYFRDEIHLNEKGQKNMALSILNNSFNK